MPLFGIRRRNHHSTRSQRTHRSMFHRRDPERVAGGYKAALANPHTTRQGRKHAEHELHKRVSVLQSFYGFNSPFLL
ncbi:hypothetical protein DL96DRAFT_1623776 [Flagelloscypha sp. PMI_526]|nr:hypothetical protein DL96DRAFT_1630107 [Flagelloscypha sp. PMI_526]KAH8814436.1 hypothetical protein DL96DRAFT_1623776 [Flagelloscypha sp. PMI_526]